MQSKWFSSLEEMSKELKEFSNEKKFIATYETIQENSLWFHLNLKQFTCDCYIKFSSLPEGTKLEYINKDIGWNFKEEQLCWVITLPKPLYLYSENQMMNISSSNTNEYYKF